MKNKPDKKNLSKNILIKKENAISSLFEVEHFLCNFKKICNTLSLYKILK